MFGVLLVGIGQIFAEIGVTIGKHESELNKESLYAMGFLSLFWATVLMALGILIGGREFVFSLQSLPTFGVRAVFEIVILFVTLRAIRLADRSTFTFLHATTVPLLLGIDIALDYTLKLTQLASIGIFLAALGLLLSSHSLSKEGKAMSLLAAVLAAVTISLYKYDITHFNSVAAEQVVMSGLLLVTVVLAAKLHTKENVFRYLTHGPFMAQSLALGFAHVCMSFAYLFTPASVTLSVKRCFESLVAIVSGRYYFHETNLLQKSAALALIFVAIGLLLI